ncbi:MAG: aspartate carbamoyltransferase catalytic subunit [Alphaproteobacteria bacterium]|nr:aspartate carbamoyltransferase catalytic subunit [Alphaproteobacteria bacterium]
MTSALSSRHLIDTAALSKAEIEALLNRAEAYVQQNLSSNKKSGLLSGRTAVNLFFEKSTRTRTSFDLAAKRLGMDVINVPLEQSSLTKGETDLDTVFNIDAMHVDVFVIRHIRDGFAEQVSRQTEACIVNAGDGKHAHPTQALLDALTIRRHKGSLNNLTVALCGDVSRSRVARSNIHLLKKFGADIRVIAPDYFMSEDYAAMGVTCCADMDKGLRDADAIIMLRVQNERDLDGQPFDFIHKRDAYIASYGLSHDRLKVAKDDVIVLHPGPVNRGVEMTDALTDDRRYSVIREQVGVGVAVRMAVFDLLLSSQGA